MDARLAAVVVAGGREGVRVGVGAGGGMESVGVEKVAEAEAPAVSREPAGAPPAGDPLPAPPLLARPLAAVGKGAAAVGKGAAGAAWRAGWGSFTVNLFRPRHKVVRRRHKEERWTDFLAPRGRRAASSFAEAGGVSVKIMRHWSAFDRRRPEVGDAAGPPRPPFRPAVDLAIGLGFDEGAFEPRCRLKVANVVTVKLLPEPALKAKYLSPTLPGTRLAVEAAWFSPLRNLTGPADLVKPPAGVYVRLRNAKNAGPALNGRGLEFNQEIEHPGTGTTVRVHADLDFPAQLPPPDIESLFSFHVNELSITQRFP